MEIRKLDHAALLVKDVDRSRRFYGQVLGMQEVPRPSNFNFPGAWFRKDSAEIHLIGEAEPGRVAQVQPGDTAPQSSPLATFRILPLRSQTWKKLASTCRLMMWQSWVGHVLAVMVCCKCMSAIPMATS